MGYVSPDLRKRVEEKVAEIIAVASAFFNQPFATPRIAYELSGTVAGRATYASHQIDLNYILLQRETEDMVNDTVPHEVAHLITGIVYPETKGSRNCKGSPHGPEWQSVMRVLGVNPSRCHTLDVSDLKRVTSRSRVIRYMCSNCKSTVRLSQKHHEKLKMKPDAFWHSGCKGWKLVLASEHAVATAAAPIIYTPPAPAPVIAHAATTPAPTILTPRSGSKLDACESIYVSTPGITRADMLRKFMAATGIGQAHAGTYYQTIKKRHGG